MENNKNQRNPHSDYGDLHKDCRNAVAASTIPRIRDMDKIESMGSLESRQVYTVQYKQQTECAWLSKKKRSSNRRSKNKGNRQSPSK